MSELSVGGELKRVFASYGDSIVWLRPFKQEVFGAQEDHRASREGWGVQLKRCRQLQSGITVAVALTSSE